MEDRISLIECYLLFAKIISKRSTCKRYGTGTVITSTDMTKVFSVGYNGSPHNVKHNCNGKIGSCSCLHSEQNALLKKNTLEEAMMFLTHSPCEICARFILQSNIKIIYYAKAYRILEPVDYLKNYGIQVIYNPVNKITI